MYIISYRFVGYLEEEAVKTYTDIIDAIDNGAPPPRPARPAPRQRPPPSRAGCEPPAA